MTNVIITSPEALKEIVGDAIAEHLSKFKSTPDSQPDSITMDTAIAQLGENGYPTSRGKIYKLTSNNEIPHNKYGNKLVFSRKELLAWADSQAVKVDTHKEAMEKIGDGFKRRCR